MCHRVGIVGAPFSLLVKKTSNVHLAALELVKNGVSVRYGVKEKLSSYGKYMYKYSKNSVPRGSEEATVRAMDVVHCYQMFNQFAMYIFELSRGEYFSISVS